MSSQPSYLYGRGRGRATTKHSTPSDSSSTEGRTRAVVGNGSSQQRPGNLATSGAWSGSSQSPKSPSFENQRLESSLRSVEDLFAKARSEHMKAAHHHLQNTADDLDDSEDEEEDIGSIVLNGIFQSYAKTFEIGNGNDVHSAQEKLLHSFRSGTSACLVCIETIKKEEAIWSCSGCFCMFHLPCIQKWVREGVYQKQYSSGDFTTDKSSDNIMWHCPKCRHEYSQSQCPTRYFCFCGKQPDPQPDPWLVPHSCGNVCGRRLTPECGHSCLLLCHPGACPPCPAMVKSACHCGKSAPRMVRCNARSWTCGKTCGRTLSCKQHQCLDKCHAGACPPCPAMVKSACHCGKSAPRMVRCNARSWTCGKTCGRTLSCKQHQCLDKCHAGECAPCTKTSVQACCCGKQKSERPCDSVSWQCGKPCGKLLSCGNHLCENICHSGPCGNCPRSGPRRCPCGKTEFQLPCTEDIPTCGDTCGKPLACGQHYCTQRCHLGECGQCMQMAIKKCRCGQRQKEFPCAKEFHCDKKCNNLRNCGVHKCNRKCCDGNCPRCEQICGKTLRCRNHKCASQCHKGPCYPCPLTMDITCNCKRTKITVPCGKERVTKPPRCNLPCKTPPACHHPSRQKHRCHFGDCPPCSFVCGRNLDRCGHTCPVVCHDAVKTKVQDEGVKAGPWEQRPVRIETLRKPCPPCQVAIPMKCLGGHETSEIPCFRVKPYSCGRKCGRRLACGNHTCELQCHAVTAAPDAHTAGTECKPCELGCEVPRPDGCTHPCVRPCHPPPCPPCHMMIRMRCHCQTLVKHIECDKWNASSQKLRDTLKSCGQPCPKELPCGHPCGAVCHSGPCPNAGRCQKKVTLKCRCKKIKKDVVCSEKGSVSKLECDSNCRPNQKNGDELAKQKEEEEEKKKQEAELLEYERMMKGRKKKHRKQKEEVQEETFWSKYKLSIVVLILGIAAACGAMLYTNMEF